MDWYDNPWEQALPQPVVATIGNYDGLHRGQQAILSAVVEEARRRGQPAVVVTFDPHPRAIVDPTGPPFSITTPSQKKVLLEAAGVDAVVEVRFAREVAALSAEEFVRDLLVARLRVSTLIVGANFALGKGQEGDVATLSALGSEFGFDVRGVPEVVVDGAAVSSSRIRRALEVGDVAHAGQLLGRPYVLTGQIVHGEGRGAEIGWPTSNLHVDNELFPAPGVYTTWIEIANRERLASVTNVGRRPTFGGDEMTGVETHILDFDQNVYGEYAEVVFLDRLRAERRFSAIEALQQQIAQDVQATREFFARLGEDKLHEEETRWPTTKLLR